MQFQNLNNEIRKYMLKEVELDGQQVYFSKRLKISYDQYIGILKKQLRKGMFLVFRKICWGAFTAMNRILGKVKFMSLKKSPMMLMWF